MAASGGGAFGALAAERPNHPREAAAAEGLAASGGQGAEGATATLPLTRARRAPIGRDDV